jgi:hypothetical protein
MSRRRLYRRKRPKTGHHEILTGPTTNGYGRRRTWAGALAALLAAIAMGPAPAAVAADPVAVIATQVPLDPADRTRDTVGALRYRGGLVLRSPDRRFGGYSDIHVTANGRRLIAISDRGTWLRLRLTYGEDGRLTGIAAPEMGPLIDEAGKPVTGWYADAEAFTFLPDGSALVAFERHHRLLLYPPSATPFARRPTPYPIPVGLERAPLNGGVEALAHVGSRFVFLLTEKLRASGSTLAGWVGRDRRWRPFAYARRDGFRPTGATLLPGGDVMVVERRYTAADGPAARLVVLPRATIAPHRVLKGQAVARIAKPLTVDNFEGIAARRGPSRETLVYLMSDDNFSDMQRTLLLMFTLEAP